MDDQGDLLIADWGAGTVLRVTPEGRTLTVVDQLEEPAGLAFDRYGNLFVSLHAQGMEGAGSVLKISPMGEQSVFVAGLTGPTDLTFGPTGNLYVANYDLDTIVKVSPGGVVTAVAENIPSPSALEFGPDGNLLVANANEGTLSSIDSMGRTQVIARGLSVPSDIAIDQKGHVIITNLTAGRLSYLTPKQTLRTFANVPKGTIAVHFDDDNNFILVNWDLRMAMKVATHLSIPCPHCREKIPVHIVPKKPAPRHPQTSDPEEDAGPVI
jgi:sugar lactone lactonase YvrE